MVRTALSLSILLLAAPISAFAVENGDVLIGAPAEGPDPFSGRLPSRPLLVAIDSPYEAFGDAGTFIHVAAWTADGQPARGASVYFAGERVGLADEHGACVFRWGVPDGEDEWRRGGTVAVRWEEGGEVYAGDVDFSAYTRTGSFASDQLFVYTDRGVYNPGDDVHLRVIAWNLAADYTPAEGAEVELWLSDPSGRAVAGGRAVTDELGITALDLPLSPQAEEGVYELRAIYEDAAATARLRVRRFTPPTIRIEHTLPRFLTRDQLELRFEVTLGTFTGADFESGLLELDAAVGGTSRYQTRLEVDGPGPHAITLDQAALDGIRRDLLEDDRVELTLRVTDRFGRRDEVIRELRFTRNPYVAIIELDRTEYSPGDPVELIVRLSDRERVPARDTEVTLITSAGVTLNGRTDGDGTAQFSLLMPEHAFDVEVLVADVGSAVAVGQVELAGTEPMRSHIADAVVREGQTARVVVAFPSHFAPVEAVVHVDMVDSSGSLVASALLPIRAEDGAWLAEGELAAPSWGSMLLTFFCLGRDLSTGGAVAPGHSALGLLTEGQNLAVHPDRTLTVTLDGIPDEVAPGAQLRGTVRVRDAQGNPVEAAVGAAIVDQAVLSLGDPLEITPVDAFYNPELRVLASTGSAMLTWPVVSRNWGPSQRDIALPPFDFQVGGAVAGVWVGRHKVEFAVGSNTDVDTEGTEDMAMGHMVDSYSLVGEYGSEWAAPEAVEPPVITIRTEFPDTSLWEPLLRARGGEATLAARVHDAITTQEVILVASDARGGVGLLRLPVRVTQPLWVQADLPDRMAVGDRVEAHVLVHNRSDARMEAEVVLAAEGIEVEGGRQEVSVAAGESALVTFPVTARSAGAHVVTASARAQGRQDVEERTVWVRPVGAPEVSVWRETLTAAVPLRFDLDVPAGGQRTEVALDIAFPAVTLADGGLAAVRAELSGGDAFSVGGEITAAALVYDLHRRTGLSAERLIAEKAELERGLAYILAAQRGDGGWGFFWDLESSPYVSAYCLEVLTTLDAVGLMVPTDALQRAVDYLAGGAAAGWDFASIAWWEGDGAAVTRGLSAEVFSVLAGVPARARTYRWRQAIEGVAPAMQATLEEDGPELLTYAHALIGLWRAQQAHVIPDDADGLRAHAVRLNRLRREAHWEPSWFNAYGGTIEATTAFLSVYAELGMTDVLEVEAREAVAVLLSTRDEWGGWHNPRGTAAAIRALSLALPQGETAPAEVVVRADGRELARVHIDPRDPFLSATQLRQMDLSGELGPGRHRLEVSYDGALAPQVTLVQRHWGEATALDGRGVSLEAALQSERAHVSEIVTYRLVVQSTSAVPRLVHLDVVAPANAEIDASAFEVMREAGLVEGVDAADGGYRLTLRLAGEGRRVLELPLVARRPGLAVVPAAVATVVGAGDETEGLAVAVVDAPFGVLQ